MIKTYLITELSNCEAYILRFPLLALWLNNEFCENIRNLIFQRSTSMDICCSMASVFTPLTRKRSAGICQNNFQVLFIFFSLNVPPQDEEVLKKVGKYIFKQLYEVYENTFF